MNAFLFVILLLIPNSICSFVILLGHSHHGFSLSLIDSMAFAWHCIYKLAYNWQHTSCLAGSSIASPNDVPGKCSCQLPCSETGWSHFIFTTILPAKLLLEHEIRPLSNISNTLGKYFYRTSITDEWKTFDLTHIQMN